MAIPKTLVDELEESTAYKEIGKRADVLKRVTDLFLVNSEQLSDEHLALFDEVMIKLVAEIDVAGRAAFGERVADMHLAPAGLLRKLACDTPSRSQARCCATRPGSTRRCWSRAR